MTQTCLNQRSPANGRPDSVGIGEREKYSASPSRAITTLIVLASRTSSSDRIGAARFTHAERIVFEERTKRRPRSCPRRIIGSSPCTMTTISASSLALTSATRSLARSCVGDVITVLAPNACRGARDFLVARGDHDFVEQRARGGAPVDVFDHRAAAERRQRLAGNLDEPIRAGITPMIRLIGAAPTARPASTDTVVWNSSPGRAAPTARDARPPRVLGHVRAGLQDRGVRVAPAAIR